MSASSKPPRKAHPSHRPPTTDRVARVLLDAEVFGDRAAAARHRIHRNTVIAWRRDWGASELVVAEMNRLRAEVRAGWIDEARDARRALVGRVVALAEKSKDLTAVTNALRRVHEVVASHEILSEPGADDAEHDGADHPEDPGEAQGPGGDED